jgi:hypothetical protein
MRFRSGSLGAAGACNPIQSGERGDYGAMDIPSAQLPLVGPLLMKRIRITLRVWIVVVALSAAVLAACTFAYDWTQKMERIRRGYLSEAAGYARDEGFSNEAWLSSLRSLESVKIRASETLELVKRTRSEEAPRGKSMPEAEGKDPLDIEIESLRIESENDAKRMVEQAEHIADFWFEDMIYSSAMKQRYLNAASHPWREAPAYLSKSSFLRARKTGDIPK